MFDGEPRDGGHSFEEAQDNVLTLGDQRVVEPFKMSEAKWVRSVSARAMLAVSPSVFGLLCSGCGTVMSRGQIVETTRRLTLRYSRSVSMLSDWIVVVIAHLARDGAVVTVLNNSIVVQPDDAKV